MIWQLAICLIAFDLVHRFKLIPDGGILIPERRPIFLGPEDHFEMMKAMQTIGHSLLHLSNKKKPDRTLDFKGIYRIQCRHASQFLTVANENPENETGNKTLLLFIQNWADSNEQKWKLKKNGDQFKLVSQTTNLIRSKELGEIEVAIRPRPLHHKLKFIPEILGLICLGEEFPEQNSTWVLERI